MVTHLSLKLERDANKGWKVFYHDPNGSELIRIPREKSWDDCNKRVIKGVCENFEINATSIEEIPTIIPNYSSKDLKGSCDMISSIASASMILGKKYMDNLTKICEEKRSDCIEY